MYKLLKPENVFFLLGLTIGLFMVFVNPPFLSPDEFTHYVKVVDISGGNLFPSSLKSVNGAYVPRSEYDFLASAGKQNQNVHSGANETREFVRGTSPYSPLVYAPGILGNLLGKVVGLGYLPIFYLSRILFLLSFLAIFYFAIKTTVIGKWFFAAIGLLPTSLYIASSISGDQLATAFSFLTVAIFAKYFYGTNKIDRKIALVMISISLVFALLKPPYALLTALFLFIPADQFESKRMSIQFKALLILGASCLFLVWGFLTSVFVAKEVIKIDPSQVLTNPPANPALQKAYILGHLFSYISIILHTLWNKAVFYIGTLIGVLGQVNIWFNGLIYYGFVFLLGITLFLDSSVNLLKEKRDYVFAKVAAVVLIIILGGLIFTALYVGWTTPMSSIIEGVQGRYLLPLLAPIPFILNGFFIKKIELNETNFSSFFILSITVLYALIAYSLVVK